MKQGFEEEKSVTLGWASLVSKPFHILLAISTVQELLDTLSAPVNHRRIL